MVKISILENVLNLLLLKMTNRSKRIQLMVLLCQTIGVCNINSIPTIASSHGTAGCVITIFLLYLFLGIPLFYMESIIGQFTGRDCIDVWRIRPGLSYTGYILILWQVLILFYNHTFVSFSVHYFLISFENPIPYYQCGPWSTRNCNILIRNYTITEDCVRHRRQANYCDSIYQTFPEYQYWRNYVLQHNKAKFYIAWRVCLASGLVCAFLYISCFKRKQSLNWFVNCLPIYPILSYIPVMMGSMVQKGLVVKFEEALDLDFTDYAKKFRFSNVVQQIVYNLGLGSGLTFNFTSTVSFRSNCFSNSVVSVVISAVFSILVICTNAMMTCPYAYQHSTSSGSVIKMQMSMVFEKVPRLLSEYDHKLYWLILVYSCYVVVSLCTSMLVFYNLLEMVAARNEIVASYPGLTCLVAVIVLFLVSIPLLSKIGVTYAIAFRRYISLVSTFVTMIECIVFVMSYGVHKFSEDVHFMLGIQPSIYMRTTWVLASGILAYSFCSECIYYYKSYPKSVNINIDIYGQYILCSMCGIIVFGCAGKLLVALCKRRFSSMFRLDPSWGPKSDILQRSRAMFSAQAMTKEYMYRQYHLQAGILTRQKNSNKRTVFEFEEQRFSM
ncbi:sodium-dependent noradrenaline transporter-like [Epargyreus clarus]|uniref:sodium-dependent noradrenaline transporter-like n=1 Tax=Epargyreus clarus TaxID=520877 RepID=UPI003C2F6AAD